MNIRGNVGDNVDDKIKIIKVQDDKNSVTLPKRHQFFIHTHSMITHECFMQHETFLVVVDICQKS